MAEYTDEQIQREISEAKSLRWLAINFPKIEKPKNDVDRMQNCIHNYCSNAANVIERQEAEIERLQGLLSEWKTEAYKLSDNIDNIKSEAIKECLEWLQENDHINFSPERRLEFVKEMIGESNG